MKTGETLGPYRVVDVLGVGGMGEVYRARNTRLDRDVAVKVLPPALARDAAALARFEREARAVAALSHPNILGIFDVGREGPTAYVVTELLEGETLRERLAGGALPVRKAADYAAQMARGLAAAHERGIVHRDLKPENVFVTADGQIKILDFGLAKQEQPATVLGPTDTPTRLATTDPGVVVGTVAYMAPEQVRGRSLLVLCARSGQVSGFVERVDLQSGKREVVRQFVLPEHAGVLFLSCASVPAGPRSYAGRGFAAAEVGWADRPAMPCSYRRPGGSGRSTECRNSG